VSRCLHLCRHVTGVYIPSARLSATGEVKEMFGAGSAGLLTHGGCWATLEATQGQMDGFFIQLPYKNHQNRMASVGDWLKICPWVTSRAGGCREHLGLHAMSSASIRMMRESGMPSRFTVLRGTAHDAGQGGALPCSSAAAYLRLIDSCIAQLKARATSRTCNESKGEEKKAAAWSLLAGSRVEVADRGKRQRRGPAGGGVL